MASEPTGGFVSLEAQTPLYYLRNGVGRNAAGSTAIGSGAQSLEDARRAQLRAEHPEYNAFMIDMALYQEQQAAREVNRKKREDLERGKERRLAARLKEVDRLVSLPTLKDADGNPVPLDKKAFVWLRQYHPHLADQFDRLVGLSVSVEGSTRRRNVLSDEQAEARVAAKEAEMSAKLEEHDKLRRKEQQLRIDRLEWFRTEYDKKLAKAKAQCLVEQSTAHGTLKESRQRVAEASVRREHRLEELSQQLQQELNDRAVRQSANRRKVLRERSASHSGRRSRSPSKAQQQSQEQSASMSQRNAERAAHHAELLHAVNAKDAERRRGIIAAHQEAEKKLLSLSTDRKALVSYQRQTHQSQTCRVMGRCVDNLDTALSQKRSALDETLKRVEAAAQRKEAALAATMDSAREVAAFASCGDVPRNEMSSPRYAQPIGNVSPRSSSANLSLLRSTNGAKSSNCSATPQRTEAEQEAYFRACEAAERSYTSGIANIEKSQKEIKEAAKRREEYAHEISEQRNVRGKHEAQVRARHRKQLEEDFAALSSKMQHDDEKVRVFVPQPPRLYQGRKEPPEKVPSPPRHPASARRVRAECPAKVRHFIEHVDEVQERFAEIESLKRSQAHEAHAHQLQREVAAAGSRADNVREQQDHVRSTTKTRQSSVHKRADDDLRERLSRTFDDSKLEAAATRRSGTHLAQSQQFHDLTDSKYDSATRRREEMDAQKESSLIEDVQRRREKHRHMFRID